MFEDDEPAQGGKGAKATITKNEIESSTTTITPAANLRSRALSTQYKLDQLEKQRELAAKKKAQRVGSGLVQKTSSVSGADGGGPGAPAWATSKSGAGGGGLRVLDGSSDDDDEDERLRAQQRAAVQSAALSNDRGSAVSGLRPGGPGKRGALTNAEKKLSLLGLSTEVDSTRPRAARRAPQPAADGGSDDGAEGDDLPVSHARSGSSEAPAGGGPDAEDDDQVDPIDLEGGVLDDIRSFVFSVIPKSQPTPVQCYIKRVRSGFRKLWPYYTLYVQDPDKFLLAGRRRKKNKQSMYLISTDETDMSKKGDSYAGKVKSNFVGTEFTMYDAGANPKKMKGEQEAREELGVVQYDKNVLGNNGPRKMQVWVPRTSDGSRERVQPQSQEETMSNVVRRIKAEGDTNGSAKYMKLVNKTPRWNQSLGAFCLNFQGRVTVASVKNFQLVDEADEDRVILQFGKCSDDTFTMDYAYPLCAMQAFAICLSSFDHKLACE